MEWDRKPKTGRRGAGLILLGVGLVLLAGGAALAVTLGTIYAALLLLVSALVNTAAVFCLRRKKN